MASTLFLSDGSAWEVGSHDGAVEAWVETFSSLLGLDDRFLSDTRRLLFCRVRYERTPETIFDVFPFLPRDIPPDQWRRSVGHSVVFAHHPESRDVFCGLMPATESLAIRQMHQALLPVYAGVVDAGGLPLHGASIGIGDSGLLLLGQSGEGKTTCCGRLPTRWSVLGDDMALVVQSPGGNWMVHPLPTWSAVRAGGARWPCRVNRALALKALFLLEQARDDSVEVLNKADAAVAVQGAAIQMLRSIGHIDHGNRAAFHGKVFENAVSLSKSLLVYRLRVSLGGRFWEKIEAVLEKGDSPLL